MRIAALDLGSNSFHLVVVEANPDQSFSPLVREKEMLRLGDRVAATGFIGAPATDAAIAVLRRFRAIADAHNCDEIIALGTAALREAADGPELCERAAAEAGIAITVVDGIREAQLVFTAVRHSVLLDPAPALCADLGGGSLEVMVGDRQRLHYAASLHLGVGRLTAEVPLEDPPGASGRDALADRVHADLDPVLAAARRFVPRMLVGTSGTLLCLARMAVALRAGEVPEALNQLRVEGTDLDALSEAVFSRTTEERAAMPGCDQRRAELLPAGMAVLDALRAGAGVGTLTVSEWALREGIVLESIGAHDRAELSADPRALRRASVLSLCRRSNWRQPHARRVAAMACTVFDATRDLHGLGVDARELLEFAALAHDIGEHIARTDHDRHGAYLIENGGLRGFAPDEIRLLACIVRLHVRGAPRASIAQYRVLDREERRIAGLLAAVLRVADALDSGHSGAVEALEVHAGDDVVELVLSTHGDAEVERWSLRRKKELFERLLDRRVQVRTVAITPAVYEADAATGLA